MHNDQVKRRVIELRLTGVSYRQVQAIMKEEFGLSIGMGTITSWSRDAVNSMASDIEQLNDNQSVQAKYEYDDENLYVYSSITDEYGEKEKKRFEIPFIILNDIQKKYVNKGSNWTGQQIINNNWGTEESPLYIDWKAWNAIKSALNLGKHSGICNEVFLKILEDKYGEEILDEYIEETALTTSRQRHIDKELKALSRAQNRMYDKALRWIAKETIFLEALREAVSGWRVRDVQLPEINKIRKEKWRLFGASDFHFGVSTTEVTKNLKRMTQYIVGQDIDTAYIVLGGDFFENLIDGGFHPGMERSCDMHGFDLLMYVVTLIEDMLLQIRRSGKKVIVYGLRGNHDRIGKDHGQDSERIGALATYEMITRGLSQTDIEVVVLGEDFNSIIIEGINFILHHGDKNASSKAQKNPENILWKHGVTGIQNIIIYGDKHNWKTNETLDADCIGMPAMCPQGSYARKLDLYSKAGFIEMELIWGLPSHRVIRV